MLSNTPEDVELEPRSLHVSSGQGSATVRASERVLPPPQDSVASVRLALPLVCRAVATVGELVTDVGGLLTFERDEVSPLPRPFRLVLALIAHRTQRFFPFGTVVVAPAAGDHPVEGLLRLCPLRFRSSDRRFGQFDPVERECHLGHLGLRPRGVRWVGCSAQPPDQLTLTLIREGIAKIR
ncbi:hypothetical protein BJF90_07780 [Pseudonocardia sp. CNS-004]|nr:hypothetical protein BJF90_07780 [Pseudonocardia sp. CNS-004]